MSHKSSLQSEIGKQRPFDSPEEEAYLNLLRTTDHLSAGFAHLFKSAGLSEATYNVLRILRGAGAQGLPCQEVRNRLIAHLPDVTRLMDRLEKQGLLQRTRTSADRRLVLATITPEGRKRLDALDEPIRKLHQSQLGHLTSDELKTLSRLLEKCRESSKPGRAE